MADPCIPCGQNPSSYAPPPIQPCGAPTNCTPVDASCVTYTGPALLCSGVEGNVEEIISSFDAKLCEATGDWSTYEYNCLNEDVDILTAADFVSAITERYCGLEADFATFTTATFPNTISGLQAQITSITNPALNLCAGSGITASDTYTSILTKLANKVCEFEPIDVSLANWNSCFVTSPLPVTVVEGFNVVLGKLCELSGPPQVTLPTFNNQGSCLPTPGTSDTLVSTINKIKTRLCQSPTYEYNSNQWVCLTPATPTLQGAMDTLIAEVQVLKQDSPTFDPAVFEVTDNGCGGKEVTISGGFTSTDRFVASDGLDMSPGTLADKLEPGTNITLSNTTTPGKITINAASSPNDQVKVNSSDTSGFLQDKLTGGSVDGLTITTTTNVLNSQVEITPSIDWVEHTNALFTAIENNSDLYTRFCTLICACRPCNTNEDPSGNKELIPLQQFLTIEGQTVYYIPALAGNVRLIYSAIENTVLPNITLVNGTVTIPSGYEGGQRVDIIAERTTP